MARKETKEIKDLFKQIKTLMKPSGDANEELSPSAYEDQINDKRKLLQQLSSWLKASEFKIKTAEKRNKLLAAENEVLKNTLYQQQENIKCLNHKFQYLQSNHQQFVRMKEEYKIFKESRKKYPSEDKDTSVTNLRISAEKSTQTSFATECGKCKLSNAQITQKQLMGKEPSVNLTKSELSQLEEDMGELKSVLGRREATWNMMSAREKKQRLQLSKISTEMSTLREVANNSKNELESKTQCLENVSSELKKSQREVIMLQKHISRIENKEKCVQHCKKWLENANQFI